MKRIATIAAFALAEEAVVIWLIHTGRDLLIRARVESLIRQAYSAADDRKRVS